MGAQIIRGNALQIPLADQSVHCIVTSPPYWGLRDYGVGGQIGLEPTFDEYLQTMLAVMRECKRVLRNDGTLWLNMGDGYAGSGKGLNGDGSPGVLSSDKQRSNEGANNAVKTRAAGGLKPKDLIGQPWALAFALRADGWYLRSDIIWHKPAPMPESVSDRPTKAHEYLFLLSKSEKYFFDQAAWREPCENSVPWDEYNALKARGTWDSGGIGQYAAANKGSSIKRVGHPGGRNRRTVWTIAPQPTPEALVEPCLLAGCPKYCCPTCGQGWEPIEEKTGGTTGKGWHDHGADLEAGQKCGAPTKGYKRELKGYAPTCACGLEIRDSSFENRKNKRQQTPNLETRTPNPGTAFDPFSGSGTVCAVAHRMGYNGIGLELNPAYIEIAKRRIFADVTPTPEEKAKGQRLVFAEGKP